MVWPESRDDIFEHVSGLTGKTQWRGRAWPSKGGEVSGETESGGGGGGGDQGPRGHRWMEGEGPSVPLP